MEINPDPGWSGTFCSAVSARSSLVIGSIKRFIGDLAMAGALLTVGNKNNNKGFVMNVLSTVCSRLAGARWLSACTGSLGVALRVLAERQVRP
ncbi:hypothetical protein ACRZ5O_19805 [Pseudomonas protegens]|uniref:hypothetical protein n=1 Tax=Pseudomonas protegens TaxID=380021 RepID=UPI001F19ADB0|nr:hypothetical protein [Pseudomonas protegens]WRV89133.1 hypothetical protein VP719_19505 [Pseudomonas protegens]